MYEITLQIEFAALRALMSLGRYETNAESLKKSIEQQKINRNAGERRNKAIEQLLPVKPKIIKNYSRFEDF